MEHIPYLSGEQSVINVSIIFKMMHTFKHNSYWNSNGFGEEVNLVIEVVLVDTDDYFFSSGNVQGIFQPYES